MEHEGEIPLALQFKADIKAPSTMICFYVTFVGFNETFLRAVALHCIYLPHS